MMKFSRICQIARKLKAGKSGNATLMVALGLPALIGASGVAVDMAQWYLWKHELQYAVDQAAVAGALARSNEETENDYSFRAIQEFNANVDVTRGMVTTPSVSLEDYAGGNDNVVMVTASATDALPFSSFLTGNSTTVRARAQATWEHTDAFTACLLALDEAAANAVWFNGGPEVIAGCGVVALSNDPEAITVSGNGDLQLGWVVAAGGVDDYFDTLTNTLVIEGAEGLFDPYAGITPPENTTPRSLSCASSSATYTATYKVDQTVTEYYYSGSKRNQLVLTGSSQVYSGTTTETGSATANTYVGQTEATSNTSQGAVTSTGNGSNKTYYRTDTVTDRKSTVLSVSQSGGSPLMQPGTYTDFNIACDTQLAPGIYVIDGGDFEINAQHSITGDGVMFVLKNGAGMKINGGAGINLTGMDAADLQAVGVSPANAETLDGMLFFEDPNSQGTTGNKINGNAATYLNGTVYLPKSELTILGTASVSSRCLTLAAKTLKIGGTADMSTFCPPGMSNDTLVSNDKTKIRLVG
jgi:Flp pilus assembly protein TadG